MSDTLYWNNYYSEEQIDYPSNFATVARSYMSDGDRLVELGCGSGRDLQYFAESGITPVGMDSSHVAVGHVVDTYQLPAIVHDFTLDPEIPTDHIYSRWTLHSIDDESQDAVFAWVTAALPVGGCFFIEVRTTSDDLCGIGDPVGNNAYINTHYRRFIEPSEITSKLYSHGYDILHLTHGQGLSVLGDNDPHLIRLVARKQQS